MAVGKARGAHWSRPRLWIRTCRVVFWGVPRSRSLPGCCRCRDPLWAEVCWGCPAGPVCRMPAPWDTAFYSGNSGMKCCSLSPLPKCLQTHKTVQLVKDQIWNIYWIHFIFGKTSKILYFCVSNRNFAVFVGFLRKLWVSAFSSFLEEKWESNSTNLCKYWIDAKTNFL